MDTISSENDRIIQEICKLIEDLKIYDKQEKLISIVNNIDSKELNINDVCNEKDLFNAKNNFSYYFNRIKAVNEAYIHRNDMLKSRINQLEFNANQPCGIIYMDMPLNSTEYVVQLFYKTLNEKYINEPVKYKLLGLIPNPYVRTLKLNSLLDVEREIAIELDKFIKYINVKNQLNELVNLCKSIIYNYLDEKK